MVFRAPTQFEFPPEISWIFGVIVLLFRGAQEKRKVKALSEELENPINIHRWRKLEGSDPTTFEMIQKIHMLQKRLISKTEEVR